LSAPSPEDADEADEADDAALEGDAPADEPASEGPPAEPGAVHVPVLVDEVLHALAPRPGARFLDGTLGAGGHARVIIPLLGPGGLYVGLDRDPEILEIARARLAGLGEAHGVRVVLLHAEFDALKALAREHTPSDATTGRRAGWDGLLLDVGVSSLQIDRAARGFSFAQEGPLDMRMDPSRGESAADLVRSLPEEDLANLIYRYGEERLSRRVARAIVMARKVAPIRSTNELAEVVRRSLPGRYEGGRIHPATRTFQALRIAVNDELGMLERAVADLPKSLAPGGRAAIIAFHSLEDRIVKTAFKEAAKAERLTLLSKRPVTATEAEIARNRRARSAKLRGALRPPAPPKA